MTRTCQVCGKQEGEAPDARLQRCGKCKNALYCSRECQIKDWKQGHRSDCIHANYIFKIHLSPEYIVNPEVTRVLSCPASATFLQFHEALQCSFGWASTHMYEFTILDSAHYDPTDPGPVLAMINEQEDEEILSLMGLMPNQMSKRKHYHAHGVKLVKILNDKRYEGTAFSALVY
jgi:MYND finger/Plasmid pRiA4b ORF-3-like protein